MKNGKRRGLWGDKKGLNDVTILGGIIAIFLVSAFLITALNDAFGVGGTEYDTIGLGDDVAQAGEQLDPNPFAGLSFIDVFRVLFTLIFFDFSNSLGLPIWLDIGYVFLIIIAVIVIARNLWIGGGG